MRLILASASPRRRELLAQIGVVPDLVSAADIDETPRKNEDVSAYVRRMALEKGGAIASGPQDVVLSADTVVSAGRRILGKPESPAQAEEFLHLLSGRRHHVSTAVAVGAKGRVSLKLVRTIVRFRALHRTEIISYIESNEWQGKAGGYAIQGRAAAFSPWLQGSFSGVVGLPLAETALLLRNAGIKVN